MNWTLNRPSFGVPPSGGPDRLKPGHQNPRAWNERLLSRAWGPYLLIGLVTLLVWGQTTRFEFVWDDDMFIVRNESIRSLKNIPRMFYSLEAQGSETSPLFRPLRTAQFAVLHALGGKPQPQPWIFHLANVLWHAVAAMLVYSVAKLLFERQGGGPLPGAAGLALLVSLAFAVHPVTSEVVCWAKSLDDIMATVFVLCATRALLKWREGKPGRWAAFGWFVLAVYSKESAVPFALLAIFIFSGIHRLRLRRSVELAAPILLAGVVFVVHRHLVMGQSSQTAPLSGSYAQTLIDMLPVVAEYFRLLWGVPPFCIDYSYMPGHLALFSREVLVGVALLLLILGAAVWMWGRPRTRLAGFGLLWVGLFLLPVSNLLPMMQYMAERFLYLPLIGFLLAAGAALQLVSLPNPATRLRPYLTGAIAVAGLVLWAASAWHRSWIWQDELTLFVRTSLENPRSGRVENNAISAIFHQPHMRELFPGYPESTQLRLARALSPAKAEPVIKTLSEAHRLFPDNDLLSTTLAFAYAKCGRLREALPLFELAARQNSNAAPAWVNLANSYMDNTNVAKAREACETALRLDPAYADALRLKLEICAESGDYPAALECATRLQKLDPQNVEYERRVRELENRLGRSGEK